MTMANRKLIRPDLAELKKNGPSRAVRRSIARPKIHDDDHLGDKLGLSSLDFAVIVVNLEAELGVDPFRTEAPRVRTFGQLVELYEQSNDNTSPRE